MSWHQAFNQSGVAKFLTSPAGRMSPVVAGAGFLALGYMYHGNALGIFSIVWGSLVFIAGAFDLCFGSAALGGPLSGPKIRSGYL